MAYACKICNQLITDSSQINKHRKNHGLSPIYDLNTEILNKRLSVSVYETKKGIKKKKRDLIAKAFSNHRKSENLLVQLCQNALVLRRKFNVPRQKIEDSLKDALDSQVFPEKKIKRDFVTELKKLIASDTSRPMTNFYDSREWHEVRFNVIRKHIALHGRICLLCKKSGNFELHVDHIKPRSVFPELELQESNLQVLCKNCNLGKSNKDYTDFRSKN